MIVKPLQIRGGMKAQVQLSAAALEDDGATSWQRRSSAAEPPLQHSQPFHSQLSEILTFQS